MCFFASNPPHIEGYISGGGVCVYKIIKTKISSVNNATASATLSGMCSVLIPERSEMRKNYSLIARIYKFPVPHGFCRLPRFNNNMQKTSLFVSRLKCVDFSAIISQSKFCSCFLF